MANLIDEDWVNKELKEGKVRNKVFPMLTEFGVPDYSETVHSYGLNYLTAIGRELEGITAVSECPVFAPESSLSEVRPDSVWFNIEDNDPLLIAEFERYDNSITKQKKLKQKLQNLVIGYHQLGGDLEYLLLVYWSYPGVTIRKKDELISILNEGFTLPNGRYVKGINSFQTSYLIYHAVATGGKDSVKLNKWIRVK